MKIYEIDEEIFNCFDSETGEILDVEKLENLQMERTKKIENVALWYKDLIGDANKIKIEKEKLAAKEQSLLNKAESLKKWLIYALNGEKMSTARVAMSFRKSETVEITDNEEFIKFVNENGRDDLLTYKEPVPNKSAIKAAIKDGQIIGGVTIEEKNNIQIK